MPERNVMGGEKKMFFPGYIFPLEINILLLFCFFFVFLIKCELRIVILKIK